ncbi:MAG: ATP-binding cassette domain-containing protein, partial [Clostridia bacterium]|nr:ATP-binding cassette domain-containing protein [Clostridia bacterium]
MAVSLKNVTKKYGDRVVLENFSLELQSGKINCVLGPSGSGKTTILRVLAGIIEY